ncbi:mast cell protease 1A-like [Epargyreus clarus]|uniref:mast cell protease 1A-like n=1 Tax=Epargyreus clarus TaxID=520877 RepID=UPI003C2EE64E
MFRFSLYFIVLVCALGCQGQLEVFSATQLPVATMAPPTGGATTENTDVLYYDYSEDIEWSKCKPLPPNMTASKTGQKAWDKCIEYQEQYVYPCERSLGLTFTSSYIRHSHCTQNTNVFSLGHVAADGKREFPHMALLGFGDESHVSFMCGGSIVSENYILTAAHCTSSRDLGPVAYALVGIIEISENYDKEKLYKIKKIINHPEYIPPHKYNDIALLETNKRIKMNPLVVPACLDTGNQEVEEALTLSWGANGRANADDFQKLKLSKFSQEECAGFFPSRRLMRRGVDPKTQVCYGNKLQSNKTCQGESGNPLHIRSDRIKCMHVVVGVTSFGRACGSIGPPGIYTRVAEYLPWIESIVWP